MAYDYDLIVIGGGPGGEKGALEAARLGKRVLIVDRGRAPGGAAVHTGTIPSKTLRETALFLSGREQRETYGVNVSIDPTLFIPKLLSRKDLVRKLEVGRILGSFGDSGIEYARGDASLRDANTVVIRSDENAERVHSTRYILIATGSAPFHPDTIPFEDPAIDDSDSILEIDKMPGSLVVLGGGVIGCEYASMFAAMGVKVTLVDKKPELLDFLDADMSEALRVAFVDEGIDVRLTDGMKGCRREGEKIVVDLQSGGRLLCDKLLFAAGRVSNTKGLGLEAVGVELGVRGLVKVNDEFRTNVRSIFAAGDVIGFPALASTSMEQGRIAAQAMCGVCEFPRPAASTVLPYGIYTIPEVGCVGLSEEDAVAKGIAVIVGRGRFSENARAKINGYTQGVVKLVFEKTTRTIIGAHAIGDRATELIHIGQLLVAFGASVDTAAAMVFNYPTLSECFKDAALDALGKFDPRLTPKPVTMRPSALPHPEGSTV